jgi:hypothetical protein
MLVVNLGTDMCFSGAFRQVRDQGKRVTILLCDFIQMQSQSPPSFFLAKRTGVPYRDCEGWMKPVTRCSSMDSWRATSSVCNGEYICPSGGVESSSRLIFKS